MRHTQHVAFLAVAVFFAGVARGQGGPVNNAEPTEWCNTCLHHGYSSNGVGSTNDPYWSHFPNGDNPVWGLFKLGHRWEPGLYDPTWNGDFDPSVRWNSVSGTAFYDAINAWCVANSYWSGPEGHFPELWAHLCPLDTDGDGYTNGEEMGDSGCTGAATRTTGLSNPQSASSVPPPPTTTTTTATTTTTTTTTTTAAATTAAPTTAAPTAAPTDAPATTAAAPAETLATTTEAPAAPTCDKWCTYGFAWDNSQVTDFTVQACVGSAAGDPHYETLSGKIVTCDNLGWTTLIESAEAKVEVEHVAVGATTATAIATARVTYKGTGRTLVFGATPDAPVPSDAEVLVNANGATDVNGRNYVEVQRVKTTFGTYLNVQTVFAEPLSGILVDGCPAGSPSYASASVAESAACADIADGLARYACNADVQRTGSDEFVSMAKGSEQQRAQVQPASTPASAEEAAPRTRTVAAAPESANPIVIVAIVVSFVVITASAMVFVVVLRRNSRDEKPKQSTKFVYVVGQTSEGSSSA